MALSVGNAGVLVPYKITLLSNQSAAEDSADAVLVPYKITLLSNAYMGTSGEVIVLVPYKITLLSNAWLVAHYARSSFSTL